ncbi:hypothetical protein PoB_005669900 [Plakobranchus ocellatus]|uniref:Uncharacterized protein n=1 Tax=Plakobranchus ocellatus TaxID=259542 RepID=A0AAV4CHD6_9GAST|nr:hypothetical protein PoB_005669900 [Plakobranchus ocellatus]
MTDKMAMHPVITVLSLLLLTVAPGLVSAQADEDIARRFCVDVLGQSKYDATQCFIKPKGFKISAGKDQAVLTYLCCLGLFNDVTHSYTPYMSKDLIMYVATSESASNLLSVGRFIRQCSKIAAGKLTQNDYAYWQRLGKSTRFCKAPRKK